MNLHGFTSQENMILMMFMICFDTCFGIAFWWVLAVPLRQQIQCLLVIVFLCFLKYRFWSLFRRWCFRRSLGSFVHTFASMLAPFCFHVVSVWCFFESTLNLCNIKLFASVSRPCKAPAQQPLTHSRRNSFTLQGRAGNTFNRLAVSIVSMQNNHDNTSTNYKLSVTRFPSYLTSQFQQTARHNKTCLSPHAKKLNCTAQFIWWKGTARANRSKQAQVNSMNGNHTAASYLTAYASSQLRSQRFRDPSGTKTWHGTGYTNQLWYT